MNNPQGAEPVDHAGSRMSQDHLAKEAAAARAELQRTLAIGAEALRQMADVMAESSTAMAAATAREDAAVTAYIASLERQIARQSQLN